MLSQVQICTYLLASLHSVGLLAHMESLFLILWEIALMFATATVPFHITTDSTTYQFLQKVALIIFAFGTDSCVIYWSAFSSTCPGGSERCLSSFDFGVLGNSLHIAAALWRLMDERSRTSCFHNVLLYTVDLCQRLLIESMFCTLVLNKGNTS